MTAGACRALAVQRAVSGTGNGGGAARAAPAAASAAPLGASPTGGKGAGAGVTKEVADRSLTGPVNFAALLARFKGTSKAVGRVEPQQAWTDSQPEHASSSPAVDRATAGGGTPARPSSSCPVEEQCEAELQGMVLQRSGQHQVDIASPAGRDEVANAAADEDDDLEIVTDELPPAAAAVGGQPAATAVSAKAMLVTVSQQVARPYLPLPTTVGLLLIT
jgi:hypothetical protein